MSSAEQLSKISEFQIVSGQSEKTSREFLERHRWNVGLALSSYFDAGIAPPEVFSTPAIADPTPSTPSGVDAGSLASGGVPHYPISLVYPDGFRCGLFDSNTLSNGRVASVPVPLLSMSVRGLVADLAAHVECTQVFANQSDHPVEATFTFQQDGCTVCGFSATVGGERVVGVCMERGDASDAYEDALASGSSAFLLKDAGKKNAFRMRLGNLRPGATAAISFTYVSELQMDGDRSVFAIPVTRAPILPQSDDASRRRPVVHDDDGDAMEGDPSSHHHHGLSISLRIESSSRLVDVACVSGHEGAVVELGPPSKDSATSAASVKYQAPSNTSPSAFRVHISTESPHEPRAWLERMDSRHRDDVGKAHDDDDDDDDDDADEPSSALMMTFYPDMRELAEEDFYNEVIFLVDQSGSMAGSRMNQCKNALQLFLRSLPEGTMFNLVGFGSTFQKLFPHSVEYNDRNFTIAVNHVNAMKASLIGTDILPPLKEIFRNAYNPDYPRQLFCITDGEVDNTNQVLEYLAKSCGDTRIFTLGVGGEASEHLVRGMASAGRGRAEFVPSGTRIEPAVLRQLTRALQPVLKNVHLSWGSLSSSGSMDAGLHNGDGVVVAQCPTRLRPLFDGEPLVVYAFIRSGREEELEGAEVRLCAETAEEEPKQLSWTHTIRRVKDVLARPGSPAMMVHRLAARERIKELMDDDQRSRAGQDNKEAITRLALKYSLASKYTSFVATHASSSPTEASMVAVDVVQSTVEAQGGGPSSSASLASSLAQSMSARRSELLHSSDSSELSGWGDDDDGDEAEDGAESFGGPAPKSKERKRRRNTGGGDAAANVDMDMMMEHVEDVQRQMEQSLECVLDRSEKLDDLVDRSDALSESSAAFNSCASKRKGGGFGIGGLPSLGGLLGFASPGGGGKRDNKKSAGAKPARGRGAGRSVARGPAAPPPTHSPAPSSTPAPAIDSTNRHMRPMDMFIQMQTRNGSWRPSADFSIAIGVSEDLSSSAPEGVPLDVWATALALAHLSLKHADCTDQWALLASKARKWMARELRKVSHTPLASVEELHELAMEHLSSSA